MQEKIQKNALASARRMAIGECASYGDWRVRVVWRLAFARNVEARIHTVVKRLNMYQLATTKKLAIVNLP
ncbi:MAG: hypothetical protein WBF08_05115, partial [Candidatus Bathyarchaeia archaeon]